MKQLLEEMLRLCNEKQDFALATVVSRSGSAPRSAGAKMLIRGDGTSLGTVGGGILEAQVIQLAADMITEKRAAVQYFQFSGKDAATMDAICGGQVNVLVEWIDAQDEIFNAAARQWLSAYLQHRHAWLVTEYFKERGITRHAVVLADGQIFGSLPVNYAVDGVQQNKQFTLFSSEEQWVMLEPAQLGMKVYIFGAGHVSRSLAEFTQAVGFWTVVLDNRAEFCNRERFPTAAEIMVLDTYENCFAQLEVDRESFIVIVTRGHLDDRTVLTQALKTEAGYIGMIGSRRKCILVFNELRKQGFSESALQRVHAPIGLPILAETPEEIGISIVSEMIQERAKLAASQQA